MKKMKPLHYKWLRQKLDKTQLGFNSTSEIRTLTQFIGQKRAFEALNFGLTIKSWGYNLFAMGPTGIGKYTLVNMMVELHGRDRVAPPDWCYIYNFEAPESPIAIQLPAGQGFIFQQDMKKLIDEIAEDIPAIFESKTYRLKMNKINKQFTKRKKNQAHLAIDKTPQLFHEQHKKEKALQLKLTMKVVTPLINKLKRKYKKFPHVIQHLVAVQEDVLYNVADFIKKDETTNSYTFSMGNPLLVKYKVNLFIDNRNLKKAPIIFEESPTYSNLICRIEHASEQGSLITNFTLIKPGSLHRANGGYLIIEARKIKKHREAWEALKSALYAQEIKIKPMEHGLDMVQPVSLEPMPIPLDVKIILLGYRNTYYSLCQVDPDFSELFKVAVDFDDYINRDEKNIKLYARLIGTIARKENLRPFQASAVAEIIDHSSRIAEDVEKLSTHMRTIEDIILESDYWASQKQSKMVIAKHVKQAIAAQTRRMDRARAIYYEEIKRDFIIINTQGNHIGQVNCLSVRRVGNFSYGHPTRVTATTRIGEGKIIDIQREIKMAGPMHSKAGLIIANFLASHFSLKGKFSLHASLSFEQIYCWTDGDSASVGELCALLSALANVPINQSLAVTGSIDQYGAVQAIGGVNEKIEGFFDVCAAKGLTGKQGVLIPAVNVKNLMLREDIVAAVRMKKFAIYLIHTIDDAITLLMELPPGQRDSKGIFPVNSVFYKIEACLQKFAQLREGKNNNEK